jgi:hypothetical protein
MTADRSHTRAVGAVVAAGESRATVAVTRRSRRAWTRRG